MCTDDGTEFIGFFFNFSIQLGVFSDNEKSTDLKGTFHLNEFTWPFMAYCSVKCTLGIM